VLAAMSLTTIAGIGANGATNVATLAVETERLRRALSAEVAAASALSSVHDGRGDRRGIVSAPKPR
jgi:hypothetical protein